MSLSTLLMIHYHSSGHSVRRVNWSNPRSQMSDATSMLTAEIDLGQLPDLIGYALRRAQIAAFQDFHGAA